MKKIYFSLTALVILLDQITKWMAETQLTMHEQNPVMPFFNITRMHNYGAAFSFLSDAGGWQRWFFTIIAIVISVVLVVWLLRLKSHEKWLGIGLALILGGAIGNVIDRIRLGYVVDFIQWFANWKEATYYWPSFNIADAAIFVGTGLFLLSSFLVKDDLDAEDESSDSTQVKSKPHKT